MSQSKEKACPGGGAPRQATEEEQTGQAVFSSHNNNTTPGRCGQRLYELLPHGAANAIKGRTLVALLGLHDLRELTREIHRARRAGVQICTNCSGECGCYLAGTPAELEQYARLLDRWLAQVCATRDSVHDMIQRMNGQAEVEGWG